MVKKRQSTRAAHLKKPFIKMHNGFTVSFEVLHKTHFKCTPKQIMLYQISLNLHRVLNSLDSISNEQATVLDQIICGRRQLRFEIMRNYQGKIGMNTTANKFFYVSNQIGLDLLNLNFAHYKKIMKIQFLKYGKTWFVHSYQKQNYYLYVIKCPLL